MTPATEKKRKKINGANAERREGAKTAILDSAEKLFALHGRDGVTIRAVAAESGFDPAMVHYYFDDLEGVFRAVWLRKSEIINAVRNKALDDYLAAHGDRLTVEGAFEAFLRTTFDYLASDPAYWSNYSRIVSHVISSHYQDRDYMRDAFNVTVHRFIDVLKQLAPNVPPANIYWFFQQLSGSIAMAIAQTGRIDTLSGGLCRSTDMAAACDSMITVYVGGFKALQSRY